ncbi:MAG: hypothetical protein K2X41_10405 [Hyphomicrobium sp.]|nr:hypothetical protein [Hyphomicrobium sp.]
MKWRVSVGWLVTIASVAFAAAGGPARAADAYLCGPDKIVYVAVEDLELKKLTDPCIAAYYGLKIAEPSTAAPRNPVKTVSTAAPAPLLRPLADVDLTRASASPIEKIGRQASLQSGPVSAPGTDYRNVHVLNATTPDDAFYHHSR